MSVDMDSFAQMASLATDQIAHTYHESPDHDENGGKRKADDGPLQPGQRAKRNRYISIACNECKRRKIKCNGQTPCQRCGNLQLECVYAPNCCSGFKDTQEYKEMTAHIASLQDQVNVLYNELGNLRAQIGHTAGSSLPQHSQSLGSLIGQQQATPSIQHSGSAIDPSLQTMQMTLQQPSISPSEHRRTHSRQSSSFRGPTSSEFNFGLAKSSLQNAGYGNQESMQSLENGNITGDATLEGSRATSPELQGPPPARQVHSHHHADKDPIWQISQAEALRLCRVYEDEMGLMYPVLDIEAMVEHVKKLYRFMEAAHRSGLMQTGFPGADSIDDEDTNILKMVLAVAMTVEAAGRSELGAKLFEFVQPAVDNLLLGNVGVKGIRLLAMTAFYEFHSDNESASWRIIGLTARLCIELGLHRSETYSAITDEAERAQTLLLFWSIYVLDKRWSFGTGMPFALQDADIDANLPKPEDRSPYLSAMISYCAIGTKVWRSVASSPVASGQPINLETMDYLDYQVVQWLRNIPEHLRFRHPTKPDPSLSSGQETTSRAGHRLQLLLYLRANQMRILIYRPVLHSAALIKKHRDAATKVVDLAKDTIRVLTHVNATSDLYRSQQMLFNAFLTSALAVLFLAVSHTPALYADNVREEFHLAIDLVRGFSKGSWIGKRLWKTIRILKEVAPKLGLVEPARKNTQAAQSNNDLDPSRSAAVAMAGLAGHNVDESVLYHGQLQRWTDSLGANTSPDLMAEDLTSLFEAVGGLQALGEVGHVVGNNGEQLYSAIEGFDNGSALFGGDEGLSNILRELF